jgi:hypothetical protein
LFVGGSMSKQQHDDEESSEIVVDDNNTTGSSATTKSQQQQHSRSTTLLSYRHQTQEQYNLEQIKQFHQTRYGSRNLLNYQYPITLPVVQQSPLNGSSGRRLQSPSTLSGNDEQHEHHNNTTNNISSDNNNNTNNTTTSNTTNSMEDQVRQHEERVLYNPDLRCANGVHIQQ